MYIYSCPRPRVHLSDAREARVTSRSDEVCKGSFFLFLFLRGLFFTRIREIFRGSWEVGLRGAR